MNLNLLDEPFDKSDIEWRIQQAGKASNGIWAKVLAYVTNRAIMKRLDEVCGKENWRNEYRDIPNNGGVECGISIKVGGEWVTKWDAAENTQVEAVKGGRSGAMKRAAVQWGIGRYLYNLEEGFATVSMERVNGFTYARDKNIGVFYWKAPELPVWALPKKESGESTDQENTIDPDVILKDFTSYVEGENSPEKLKEKYGETWLLLSNHPEHQGKCKDVTAIRIKELKEASTCH